jgi:hypothetical protein
MMHGGLSVMACQQTNMRPMQLHRPSIFRHSYSRRETQVRSKCLDNHGFKRPRMKHMQVCKHALACLQQKLHSACLHEHLRPRHLQNIYPHTRPFPGTSC